MTKRDPNQTARNRMIKEIKIKLRELLPTVLSDLKLDNEQSLNAIIGSKTDEFLDLKNDVIRSPEEFISHWLQGLKKSAIEDGVAKHALIWNQLKKYESYRKYLHLFLRRSYLTHYDELSKNRPAVEDAEIWIGQQNANYGLLVSPRFKDGKWENDKSEIRAFNKVYWTVGHVMETGPVIPSKNKIFKFSDIEQYLLFFQDTLVRNSGSSYEYEIAGYYCDYVRNQDAPELVPLLIPEFRYASLLRKHIYRLDFMVINPYTLSKVGFELSPWSTHGYLAKISGLTQAEINKMASDNFAKEMRKHRAYFKEHNVVCLIYPDELLADTKKLFDNEIEPYLKPEKLQYQLSFQLMEEFFDT